MNNMCNYNGLKMSPRYCCSKSVAYFEMQKICGNMQKSLYQILIKVYSTEASTISSK